MLSNAFLRFLFVVLSLFLSLSNQQRWKPIQNLPLKHTNHIFRLIFYSILESSFDIVKFFFCNKWFSLSIHNILTVINHSCICSQHKLHFWWPNKYELHFALAESLFDHHMNQSLTQFTRYQHKKSVLKLI